MDYLKKDFINIENNNVFPEYKSQHIFIKKSKEKNQNPCSQSELHVSTKSLVI